MWQAECATSGATIDFITLLGDNEVEHLRTVINRIDAHQKDDESFLFYAEVMWAHNTRGKYHDGPENITAGADVVINQEDLKVQGGSAYAEPSYLKLSAGLLHVDNDNIWFACTDDSGQVYESQPFAIRDLDWAIHKWEAHTNTKAIPYMTVGDNQLGEPLGTTIKCPTCGEQHRVEHGKKKDANGDFTREDTSLSFYRCGRHTYLCGVNGRVIN